MDINIVDPKWMIELSPERIKKYTDAEICLVLKKIPWALKFIKDPKPEWVKLAVKLHWQTIAHVENPSVELQRMSLNANKDSIAFINNLDEELALEILVEEPNRIHQISNPTPTMMNVAKIIS